MATTLFLIDPTADLKIKVREYSTMTSQEGTPTHVDYSGYLFNNKGDNLTLEEYKKVTNKPNIVPISSDEFMKLYEEYEQSLQGDWREVSQEDWYDALECLPPCRWHDLDTRFNSFYVSEAYSGRLHSYYIKDKAKGKFYTALRFKFITDGELLEQLHKL